MKRKCLIVFDMDGVLVDVSGSYRETIRHTAALFFAPARGGPLPDPLFSLDELDVVKRSGGFNNDWDLTRHVIQLLASRVDPGETGVDGDPWSAYEASLAGCNMNELAAFLKTTKSPLLALLEEKPQRNRGSIDRFYRGDVETGNIIKQIFQELYLGEALFLEVYGSAPRRHRGSGWVQQERLIPPPALLERLSAENVLAIATGRPRFEVDHALDTFRIRPHFSAVLSHDDCLAEEQRRSLGHGRSLSLLKPDPFMLNTIAASTGQETAARYYVGDLPDDMITAARADDYIGIGFLQTAAGNEKRRSDLLHAGAHHVIDDLSRLAEIIHNTEEEE